ncbi:MAG TPA: methyltransferase domain-containing protein [Bryobacteraceae bacterium]|nr:methyltransferase domain-containing protein [Bryobacteraceae bacterium]
MNAWNPAQYEGGHSYVWQFGGDLLELLRPRQGERILDLGCGTGQLTAEIAARGADVVGLDSSPEMLGQARQNYPKLKFVLADATKFHFDEPFDAVFSNAALHWVKDAEASVKCIAAALRPGGRFVAEFGGKGNIKEILAAFRFVFGPAAEERRPWVFRGIGEYASLLEKSGFDVQQASLFDRPTPVEGERGLEDWLEMFCGNYFKHLSASEAKQKLHEVVEFLRPKLYRDGAWLLDYRRLRIMAVLTNEKQGF